RRVPGGCGMSRSPSGPDPLDNLAEEFADRYRRGERPPLAEDTEKYPDLADQIRALFPAVIELEDLGSVGGPAAPPAPGGAPLPDRLGDYRLVRVAGKGGMGVVYEAVQ